MFHRSRPLGGETVEKMRANCLRHCPGMGRFEDERAEDDKFVYRPHMVGNQLLLYGKKRSRFPFQVMIGPDWYCMLVTYSLVIIPTFFFLLNVGTVVGVWVIVVGCFTGFLTVCFFSMTACSDPGIIYNDPVSAKPSVNRSRDIENGGPPIVPPNNEIECGHCNIMRPTSASHCYECGVCIDELDHHCPWTGKCIGRKTIHMFYYFLAALAVHIIFVLVVTGYAIFANVGDVFSLHEIQ